MGPSALPNPGVRSSLGCGAWCLSHCLWTQRSHRRNLPYPYMQLLRVPNTAVCRTGRWGGRLEVAELGFPAVPAIPAHSPHTHHQVCQMQTAGRQSLHEDWPRIPASRVHSARQMGWRCRWAGSSVQVWNGQAGLRPGPGLGSQGSVCMELGPRAEPQAIPCTSLQWVPVLPNF